MIIPGEKVIVWRGEYAIIIGPGGRPGSVLRNMGKYYDVEFGNNHYGTVANFKRIFPSQLKVKV